MILCLHIPICLGKYTLSYGCIGHILANMSKDQFECEVDFSQLKDYGPNAWMVRPCHWYKQEYTDCKCNVFDNRCCNDITIATL